MLPPYRNDDVQTQGLSHRSGNFPICQVSGEKEQRPAVPLFEKPDRLGVHDDLTIRVIIRANVADAVHVYDFCANSPVIVPHTAQYTFDLGGWLLGVRGNQIFMSNPVLRNPGTERPHDGTTHGGSAFGIEPPKDGYAPCRCLRSNSVAAARATGLCVSNYDPRIGARNPCNQDIPEKLEGPPPVFPHTEADIMILRQCDDFATAGAQNAPRHQRSRLSGDAKFSNFEKVDLINFF